MWRKITSFDNYSVNERGEVRNDKTGSVKRPTLNKKNGYLYVDLYKDNVRTKRPVHRLVAEAFIENPEDKPTVDHVDGNRTNNHVDNLRWATYGENNGRFGTGGVRCDRIAVFHYVEDRDPRTGGHVRFSGVDGVWAFKSVTAVAEHFGVSLGNISQMLKQGTIGRRGKMRGYMFAYMDHVAPVPKSA